MIRFSRLADYALLLMTRIAASDRHGVQNAVDVAGATGLPVPTVSKVLATLARRGLLVSQRGAKGGYVLARPPAEITVAAIVSALDGPIALTTCIKAGPGSCDIEPVCPSRANLGLVNFAVRRALEDISLSDMAAPATALGAALAMPDAAGPPDVSAGPAAG